MPGYPEVSDMNIGYHWNVQKTKLHFFLNKVHIFLVEKKNTIRVRDKEHKTLEHILRTYIAHQKEIPGCISSACQGILKFVTRRGCPIKFEGEHNRLYRRSTKAPLHNNKDKNVSVYTPTYIIDHYNLSVRNST